MKGLLKLVGVVFISLSLSACMKQDYVNIATSATNGAIRAATYDYPDRSMIEGAARGALRGVDCRPVTALCNPSLYRRF